MDAIWTSFFNQVFCIAEDALASRKIPREDWVNEEPYLYLGLIGATVLHCVKRSRHHEGIRLASGVTITTLACPAEHRPLFEVMMQLKGRLPDENEELWVLEQLVLYGQSEHKVITKINPLCLPELNGLAATIQRVSIHVSQQAFFQAQFKGMAELLLSLYREL